jgi:hypothetical protein
MATYTMPSTYPVVKPGKKQRRKLRGSTKIETNSKKPNAFDLTEASFSGALSTDERLAYLVRLGIFGRESLHTLGTKLPWYLTILHDPAKANTNAIYRPFVASLADTLVSLILSDYTLYQRVVFDLQKIKGREVGVSEQTEQTEQTDSTDTSTKPWERVLRKYAEAGKLREACQPRKTVDVEAFRTRVKEGVADLAKTFPAPKPWHWTDSITGNAIRKALKRDADTGNKLCSSLRGALGLPDDPTQPAPWQPGGEWQRTRSEVGDILN